MAKRKLVRKKSRRHATPEPEFGMGQWRWEALWWFIDQLPTDAVARLRRELRADRVYLGGHYASHAPDTDQPGVLCAALPPRKRERFLDAWNSPQGKGGAALAELMDTLWGGEGVADIATGFEDERWQGGTHEAILEGGKGELLKVVDAVLEDRT